MLRRGGGKGEGRSWEYEASTRIFLEMMIEIDIIRIFVRRLMCTTPHQRSRFVND